MASALYAKMTSHSARGALRRARNASIRSFTGSRFTPTRRQIHHPVVGRPLGVVPRLLVYVGGAREAPRIGLAEDAVGRIAVARSGEALRRELRECQRKARD